VPSVQANDSMVTLIQKSVGKVQNSMNYAKSLLTVRSH
jgi:hypothetical protein